MTTVAAGWREERGIYIYMCYIIIIIIIIIQEVCRADEDKNTKGARAPEFLRQRSWGALFEGIDGDDDYDGGGATLFSRGPPPRPLTTAAPQECLSFILPRRLYNNITV